MIAIDDGRTSDLVEPAIDWCRLKWSHYCRHHHRRKSTYKRSPICNRKSKIWIEYYYILSLLCIFGHVDYLIALHSSPPYMPAFAGSDHHPPLTTIDRLDRLTPHSVRSTYPHISHTTKQSTLESLASSHCFYCIYCMHLMSCRPNDHLKMIFSNCVSIVFGLFVAIVADRPQRLQQNKTEWRKNETLKMPLLAVDAVVRLHLYKWTIVYCYYWHIVGHVRLVRLVRLARIERCAWQRPQHFTAASPLLDSLSIVSQTELAQST